MMACFSAPKSVHLRTSFYQQSTTTSPQKHHAKDADFRKTPCKKGLFHYQQKVGKFLTKNDPFLLSKAKRRRKLFYI